jgi:CDP-4-dehydro-6-deoxyglucose reductase/ferredoxin-NAD(P)+ reductase (naphthalene dioxygenase ferredoxin-specific)
MLSRSRPMFCRVVGLEEATPDIRIVRLEIVTGGPFRFAAGQYARLTFGERRPRDYSMASCPDDPLLEFHVRYASAGGASAYVARELRIGDGVWVEGPFGEAWLRRDHRGPILAIAGGSGLAPIKSIVETAVRAGLRQPMHVYFGARDEDDIYLEQHFRELAALHPGLRFVPVLSEPAGQTERRVSTVVAAVAADIRSFAGMKAYLAGPPAMVEAGVLLLRAAGLPAADIHADPFYPMADAQNAPAAPAAGR